MLQIASHPVLTLDEAKCFEADLFGGDEAKEWNAMRAAGAAVAEAALADFQEIGPFPRRARLLVLVGKGHNGGDALLAAKEVLATHADAEADVWLAFGQRELRPLALKAYLECVQAFPRRVRLLSEIEGRRSYDLSLDGVFGFQFRPPVDARLASVFTRLNAAAIAFRAAIDLPSGLGDTAALKADFTYATGSVKAPTLEAAHKQIVGRLRYLDLGFFDGTAVPPASAAGRRVLSPDVLRPLRRLRDPHSDKRTYGHLFILGGSRQYPGAILMTVRAALRSGAGLVTAFVPETFVASYAARAPEAMWVGWPETPEGGLALEGFHLLRERFDRATALAMGPGCGREPETLALLRDVAAASPVPLVIDADALQPAIVEAGAAPRVLTPHAGEYARISGGRPLAQYCRSTKAVTLLKGSPSCISDGETEYTSCGGGPVLARGGSGDVLAGLVGGLLAQTPQAPLEAAVRAVVWQGRAADLLARAHGQVAVQTLCLLEQLAPALRAEGP